MPYIRKKHIQPLYDTGRISKERLYQVFTNFADQVYSKFLEAKWGVRSCIEPNFNKWLIKKNLMDLELIYDPSVCLTVPVSCCAPCGVTAVLQVFGSISCEKARNVSAVIVQVITPCDKPTEVTAVLTYQTN